MLASGKEEGWGEEELGFCLLRLRRGVALELESRSLNTPNCKLMEIFECTEINKSIFSQFSYKNLKYTYKFSE